MSHRGFIATILIISMVCIVQAKSQRTAMNSIYAEGLGPGLLYSLNYERLVMNDLGVRIGFSFASVTASASTSTTSGNACVTWMTFPITASYLGVSSGSHGLEMGGGLTLLYVSGSVSNSGVDVSGSGMGAYENILVGYRFHPVNGGFQFRAGFTGLLGNFGFKPWFYLSIGGCF